MKNFPVSNIDIDFDEIQDEYLFIQCSYLSKRKIKRAVYDFVYGRLNNENLKELANENAIIDAHWHYGWDEPVVSIPSTEGWCGVLESILEDLERK